MAYQPPIGSTVAFQSDPTRLQASVTGRVDVGNLNQFSGSVVTFLGGSTNASVITVGTPAANQSVSGTVDVGNFPVTQNISGSVFAVGSVTALQGTNPWFVQLTSGSVITAGGNSSVQVVGLMPPQSVSGVGTFNVNPVGNGSVFAVLINSSVAALQGTNPWHVTGSVLAVQSPASVSGVGIFSTNHIGGGSIFTAFRNDAIASTVGVNLTSRLVATDSAGRTITKSFAPEESRVYGVGSTVNTNPSSLLAVSGAGLRNYVTDIIMANTGTATTLVSFRDGDASVLARAIVPAGGGSNIISFATPMRTHSLNSPVEYTVATATSVLHVTAFGFKAP